MKHDQLILEILIKTRDIVTAGAMTGFNYEDSDWADRLFVNQSALTYAISLIKASEKES